MAFFHPPNWLLMELIQLRCKEPNAAMSILALKVDMLPNFEEILVKPWTYEKDIVCSLLLENRKEDTEGKFL